MFIDASAIVAILGREPDAAELAGRLNAVRSGPFVSPMVIVEATLSLASKIARETGLPRDSELIDNSHKAVLEFVEALGARQITISGDIGTKAVEAASAYGKAVGHPAQLNLGDCFAYACAKAYRVPLLYKGNDFTHTDLA
ncbi:type II toxin-antitoxin system VapC family toxin [Castellaniella sp.]|uniref:type II toxin-antitoxin system VapC family toxin n=1 Tax=Castellaniella sp. TaxID=1955812 RepID=UPI002AFF76A6|nr:type II toxin-antitoxin system VapC family toxin [Castellaniella sp.]